MELRQHPKGNYRFLTGIAPYSSAVIADSGYTLARFEFPSPIPYRTGFDRVASLLNHLNRPTQALCAMELRIPAPLPFAGFIEFNAEYTAILQAWDIYVDDVNPVARTNVAPGVAGVTEPSLHAFTLTLPQQLAGLTEHTRSDTFIVAGAGDLNDQADLRAEAIVAPGDTSDAGMAAKTETVLQVMEERLTGIGRAWEHVSATNIYTVQPLAQRLESMLLPRLGAAALRGVNWYYSRPPIAGLEYEMDLRNVGLEVRLA